AGVNAPPHVEFGQKPHESGRRRRHEIAQYFVGYGLVKRAATAKRPNVEFQGFQLDTALVGYVLEFQGGKVRLPGLRTKAAKLGNQYANGVVPLGRRVGKSFQGGAGLGHARNLVILRGFTKMTITLHYAPSSGATRLRRRRHSRPVGSKVTE